MKKEIQSHSTEVDSQVRSLWLPSVVQVLLYFFISLLVLIALNFTVLWDYLNVRVLANEGEPGLAGWISGASQTRVLQFVFWLFIGCTVYIFIWFSINIIANIRNDIVAGHYVYPRSGDRSKYWQSVLGHKVFFAVSLAALGGLLFAGYRLLPVLGDQAEAAIRDFSWHSSLLKLLSALLSTMLLIYLLVALVHLSVRTWQAVFRGL